MKNRILSLLALIGLILILGTTPVFAGDASGGIRTGVETGLGGVVKAAPTATPPAGIYATVHAVSLTALGSSTIYYTTNMASEPTTSWSLYNSPLTSVGTFNFKAAAYYADGTFGPAGQYVYTLSVPGGAGGPPASPPPLIVVPVPSPTDNELESMINDSGTFISRLIASSADHSASVTINAGITGLTSSGAPITRITVFKVNNPGIDPPPGANFRLGGNFYDFGPEGARFSGDVFITLPWDPSLGPDQYIAYLDTTTNPPTWKSLDLPFDYNSVGYTITGRTTHFAICTVIAITRPVSTSPTPLSPLTTVTPTVEFTPALRPLPTPSGIQTPDSTALSPPTTPVELPTQPLNILLVAIVIACLAALITIVLVLKWHIKRS